MTSDTPLAPVTPTTKSNSTLEVTPARAREFILDLANLDNAPGERLADGMERLARKFWPWIRTLAASTLRQQPDGSVAPLNMSSPLALGAVLMPGGQPFGPILSFGEMLRAAWRQPTRIERERQILILLADLVKLHIEAGTKPTWEFEVLLQALHAADLMRVCQNAHGEPPCAAPYFIASRRSQRYCSDICSIPAQRAYKRKWWGDYGDANRKQKMAQARRSKAAQKHKPLPRKRHK
jgi:hypothetical protein